MSFPRHNSTYINTYMWLCLSMLTQMTNSPTTR
uniref:Uncharacterized protein n=1 Tax=Rhizophora mucronata TaxID=61149 RepID=A0A2P2NRJ6_RHIMU